MSLEPIDFGRLRLFPVGERRSLVSADALAVPEPVPPEFPGASALIADAAVSACVQRLADSMVGAAGSGAHVALGMGAHPVKLGLGPHLIQLLEHGAITSVSMNGAAAFHDMELALFGGTSEDVARELPTGRFGMADEPGATFNAAAVEAHRAGTGLGEALSGTVAARAPAERSRFSILASCARLGLPVTVHVSIGTDVAHIHPSADGAALGASTFLDFRRFCAIVARLAGGVYVNLGSAVVMPEVFLKAVSVAINLGVDLAGLTTGNVDMIDHYRPRQNVVRRIPGVGIDIRGRHEIGVPALRACVLAGLRRGNASPRRIPG